MDDRLLPDHAAAHAENVWLFSGALQGFPGLRELRDTDIAQAGFVYRIPESYQRPNYFPGSLWLEFEDPDTNVVHAPVFDDTYDRYYWVSKSIEPKYNTRARIEAGNPPFLLGVSRPGSAPPVSPAGGSSGTLVTRSYVTTWVSAYGEEGPPSNPTVVTGKIDDTWTVTLPTPDPDDLGVDRNLTLVRVYRTITSSAGVATYFLVTEQPIATASYADSAADNAISGNNQLQSFSWTKPPATLEGFCMMPNGILAAWRQNEVWFSEPYRPHAWPVEYVQMVEYDIVGLGVIGQTLVICTVGNPVAATGSTPQSMTLAKLAGFEPCLSRGSIISSPEGVYYASSSGLILVAAGQAQNIIRGIITRDRWNQLTGEGLFRAARIGTSYYGFGSVVQGGFDEAAFDTEAFSQSDFSGAQQGVFIDPYNERIGFSLLSSDTPVYGVQNDEWSGEVFVLKDGKVYYIEQEDIDFRREVGIWASKKFEAPDINNFSCIQAKFEAPEDFPLNPVRNTSAVQDLQPDQYGLIRVYADDRLVMTREFREQGEVLRIPSGFKAHFWQFKIEANVKVLSCVLASTPKELKSK